MNVPKEDWETIHYFTYKTKTNKKQPSNVEVGRKLSEMDTKYLVYLIHLLGDYIQSQADDIRKSKGSSLLFQTTVFDFLSTKVMLEAEVNKRLKYMQISQVYSEED
ncbi:hypothetical protein [Bacillus weihaiensis]|uniref:Uncharacterized protein n=1 Tax=Bacillus weihaiensis TaxID=1547283 RepID=A0A1L3MVN9_9BACI|nr:hypothetical protein [Bacillus weihaiensis]APH06396.1 hypothetical protein A9C19_17575 [Bacillus weihaiensis]